MRATLVAIGTLTLVACSGSGSGGTTSGSGTTGQAGTGTGSHSTGASSSGSTTSAGTATASGSATSAGSATASGSATSTGTATGGGSACVAGSSLPTLPACGSSPASTLTVPAGCTPTVNGAYQQGEWSDAACVTVGSDPVYLKYSGSTLYLAWPMTPACGCPAQIAFSTDGSPTLDGNQFVLGAFDDPSSSSGDSFEYTSAGGAWTMSASVAQGIVIANPPGAPSLVTYEVAIPFSQLGIVPGQAKTIGLALVHHMASAWPIGVSTPAGGLQPSTPSEWGVLSSANNWQ